MKSWQFVKPITFANFTILNLNVKGKKRKPKKHILKKKMNSLLRLPAYKGYEKSPLSPLQNAIGWAKF